MGIEELAAIVAQISQIERDIDAGVITREDGERKIAAYGPRRISDVDHRLRITGYFLYSDSPVENGASRIRLFHMPGTANAYVAIFSTLEKLQAFCAEFGEPCKVIKAIDDDVGFFDQCASAGVHIMVDPYRHQNGRIRWISVDCFEGAS